MSKFMEEERIFLLKLYFIIHVFFFVLLTKLFFIINTIHLIESNFFFQEKTRKNQDDLKRKEKEIAYFQEKNTTKHFSMRSIILQAKFIMIMKVNFN